MSRAAAGRNLTICKKQIAALRSRWTRFRAQARRPLLCRIIVGPFKGKWRDRPEKSEIDRALIRPIVGVRSSEHGDNND